MKMDGDMMKMRAVDALPLPAGKPVEFKPNGYHMMLTGPEGAGEGRRRGADQAGGRGREGQARDGGREGAPRGQD